MSRLPLLPVPALACWCPWLLALCFFFPCPLAVSSPPSPFLRVGVGEGGGGGGGAFSLSSLSRKHVGSTAQARGTALVPPLGGGGGCRVAPVVTLPFLRLHPRRSPPWGLARRVPPLGTVVSSLCLPTPPRRPRGGVRRPLPSSLLSPRLLPVALASVLGGCGRWGRGGGGERPRCPSSGVSTSQARHWHAARHLSSCWGVRHAAWPLSSPCPRCVHSPGAPPAGEGGPLPAPPFLQPPPLGGRRHWGGGGLVVFVPLPSRRRHEAWLSSLCRGGGGDLPRGSLRRPFYPTPAPPVVPPPGLARRAPSTGTVVWLVPHPPSSASPPCRVVLGGRGGGRFSPPPYPHSPSGEWWCWGGGVGRPFRLPSVARMSQACRRHSTTTGRGTWLPRGGGGFPFGPSRPAPWYRPRTPGSPAAVAPSAVVATSPHGAQCPVPAPSCAHTYWRKYVPGWIRKMKKCGQRGGPTVRLEGFLRHPLPWSRGGPLFRHPTARGGPTSHPLPGACVSTSERPDTGAVVLVRGRWRLQSGRAPPSPGPLPPPSAMEAPEVLWQRRGEADGGFICGIPWPPS